MAVTRPSTIKSKTTPKTTSQDLSDCIDCFCNYCDSCHKCYCSEPPAGPPPDFFERTLSLDRRNQEFRRRPSTTNRFDWVASSFTYIFGYNHIIIICGRYLVSKVPWDIDSRYYFLVRDRLKKKRKIGRLDIWLFSNILKLTSPNLPNPFLVF